MVTQEQARSLINSIFAVTQVKAAQLNYEYQVVGELIHRKTAQGLVQDAEMRVIVENPSPAVMQEAFNAIDAVNLQQPFFDIRMELMGIVDGVKKRVRSTKEKSHGEAR